MTGRGFERLAGVGVMLVAGGAAALLFFTLALDEPLPISEPASRAIFGIWQVFYSTTAPDPQVVISAIALAVFFAASIALLERRVAVRSRRSSNPSRAPLAPKVIMEQTRGVFSGPITVTVLMPAHNEEAIISAALRAVLAQEELPARIIVVADNCTDNTAAIARAHGAEVFATVGNREKKAGALNQVLRTMLPDMGPNDLVMVVDADTVLDPGFLTAATQRFTSDRALMAVGGLFVGEEGHGLIGQFQRNEYLRYRREIARRRGRVFVLTGTASVFRATAMRTVASERGNGLPGRPGDVYDTMALTEDNELTLAIKSLGGLMISPEKCQVVTELMPTWRALWVQRLRWQRGALENLGSYRLTPHTFRYWGQQLGIGYSVIALSAFFLLLLITVLSLDHWIWFPFWIGVGSLFLLERVVTVWAGGPKARLLALTLFPELFFDMFLNVVYVTGVCEIRLGRKAAWGNGVALESSSEDAPYGRHAEQAAGTEREGDA